MGTGSIVAVGNKGVSLSRKDGVWVYQRGILFFFFSVEGVQVEWIKKSASPDTTTTWHAFYVPSSTGGKCRGFV